MLSALTAKEQLSADTPLLLFDCIMADGTFQRWSTRGVTWNGNPYDGRVVRHNIFEAQLASDTQIGGAPKLSFELANADSWFSEIDRSTGFKGGQLTVQVVFFDAEAGTPSTDGIVVFRGLLNPPETVTETTFRLTAMNRISMQRSVVPNVRIQRMCPWRFPSTPTQRLEAVDGGQARGKYSPFYRCGYSPDQTGGVGNLNGSQAFTECSRSRSDCEARGMFTADSSNRATARFGGIEFVPPTIVVRGAGQKNTQLSAVQDNTASYNNFVPLIYGTQWHVPDVVFSRNDGNLTRMEVLLGMGEIEGVISVLVNDIQIPMGVNGQNMTATGWYNLVTSGTRNGGLDSNFVGANSAPAGDPYGSMAYLSVVVPNRINDGTSIPQIQVLMNGLRLAQFDVQGNAVGEQFCSNPVWVLLDVVMRFGYSKHEIDFGSFALSAAYADELITVDDPVGGSVLLPRFQCNFALKSSQTAGDVIKAIRNASRVYLVLNDSGLLEARIENTFALSHPTIPAGSNSTNPFNRGWPSYEFDARSIARVANGGSSVRLTRRGAQDTPNRLSVEFQDSFNQYQQDSLSLADDDDVDLCGQEIAVQWSALGISTFSQASRMLLLGLNRLISGNLQIEFETSVKALGLVPGDLITVTYAKENLERTPFRIVKTAPGNSFRTAAITAQLHDDTWYSDSPTGIVGGLGRQSGRGSGLPAPVAGTVRDSYGSLQLGVTEAEFTGSTGSADVQLAVAFTIPSGQPSQLSAPLLGLSPVVSPTGGTVAGGNVFFYAVSAVDGSGGESALSFVAQANTASGSNANSVLLDGIVLPVGGLSFHVYRGSNPALLFRIASAQTTAPAFIDTGFTPQALVPPDPQFDHVNLYWRWELLAETPATIHSLNTAGNSSLQLKVDNYVSSTIRITRGTGAGQERSISGNAATTLSLSAPWLTEPDSTSYFSIVENSWRPAAQGSSTPLTFTVPERIGSGVHLSALAANAANEEAQYDLSPLTRWVIGQSGGLLADFDVPPAPSFGLSLSPSRGGVLNMSPIGFATLLNTNSAIAGTCTFHVYDELNGVEPSALTVALGAGDLAVASTASLSTGELVQIGQEILSVTALSPDGTVAVTRGIHGTTPASYPIGTLMYPLTDKVVIVPFVKGFFGSAASGDWKYSLELPDVRIASVEMFMTNAFGAGAVAANSYTGTNDNGLRTLAGGQLSFQITGYLAVQTAAGPGTSVDLNRAVRDIYAVVGTPSTGAAIQCQLNRNGLAYATVSFDAGATTSHVVSGFGLPILHSGDWLTLDVTSVGTTNPGSDLTLIARF